MPSLPDLRRLLVMLAVGGWLPMAAIADDAPAVVMDVALDQGTLLGRVVDQRGRSIADLEVLVRQGPHEVARSMTDAEGWFAISPMSPGQYDLTAGGVQGTYRVWPARVAPPTAGEHALIVRSRHGGRGLSQTATGDQMLLVTVGVIGAVIGLAITLDRVHRLPPTIAEEERAS